MQTTKPNRLSKYAGYWTVCLSCCDWSEDAVGDCWNPAPSVGWYCPKCAAGQPVHGGYPLLVERPKVKPLTLRARLWLLWKLFVDGGEK